MILLLHCLEKRDFELTEFCNVKPHLQFEVVRAFASGS